MREKNKGKNTKKTAITTRALQWRKVTVSKAEIGRMTKEFMASVEMPEDLKNKDAIKDLNTELFHCEFATGQWMSLQYGIFHLPERGKGCPPEVIKGYRAVMFYADGYLAGKSDPEDTLLHEWHVDCGPDCYVVDVRGV